ncbi:redox-regulated ATPase YchF [soil metagenome]
MSSISCGIVGLPNVGKSTLFNALLKKQQALAANYPFATIEPNVGIVPVPDNRLTQLAEITMHEEKMGSLPPIKAATVEFVDIAGLVKGASEGAGLGNKFLSHIREVSVIAHVVRAFEDPDVIREGSTTPDQDYQTIQTELIIADLQTLQKTLDNRKTEPAKHAIAKKLLAELNIGKSAFDVALTGEEKEIIKDLFLLTMKPEVIVLNVTESEYNESTILERVSSYAKVLNLPEERFVVICAKIESDLAGLSDEDQQAYLAELGVGASGLERLISKAYDRLGLISFLTAGEKEVRAWTTRKGSSAPIAAGEIHTDFTKKFIKAEVISFTDYVTLGGRKKAREVGKARLEGKDYIVHDGDVIEFKIGA